MRKYFFGLFCAGLLASQASAGIIVYSDNMFGSNEVPANLSTATGFATVTIDTVLNQLTVNESWTGLTGGVATGAHIHCCAGPGVSAMVALPFTGFPAATSGTYNNTFDLTLLATYNGAFVTASGGTAASAESTLLAQMAAGNTYTNIHDADFSAGEIRGQLLATPEPGTLILGSAGLLLLGLVRRRRP